MPRDPDLAADDRRSRLLGIKLRALVAEHIGQPVAVDPLAFPNGVAMVLDGSAWVLVDGPAPRSLGAALAWAIRHDVASLNIVAEHDTGLLARRAGRFTFPIDIWFPQERMLLAAVPEPLAAPDAPLAQHLALGRVIDDAGATVNVEHGVVAGEVRGLEVCRVVDQPTVGHFAELGDLDLSPVVEHPGAHGVTLEVGVGANDREAFRMLHGDIPTIEALAAIVESVLAHRSPDAPQHPLNRLGQERYLRWQLQENPGLVGMVEVTPSEPPQPRPNVKDPIACVARGVDRDARVSSIVCSVGVDVDLAGFVADVQEMVDAPVIVALHERDAIPITRDLLGLLATPVDVRIV